MHTKTTAIATALALGAIASHAATITWTGGAGNTDYATAGNWDLSRAPAETDDVVINGAAVTVNGNYRIPASLTLLNGASWSIGGEIQFGNTGVEHPVIYGGKVSGTLVAAQYGSSTLTISDAAIYDTGSGNNGFWQNTGSYLNFVDGDNRAASFTYQTSIAANPFWFFSHPANTPYIRYNDQVIDAATFNTHFTYTDNGDGTTTLSMKSVDGWGLGALTAGEVQNGQVAVSVTATKYSGSDATVYFVQGTRDYGDTFSSWPTATEGESVSATTTVSDTLTLEEGYNFIRAFLLYNGEYTASAVVTKRVMAPYGDYGELTGVYEFIGADNNLATPTNWALDKVPLGENDTAPVAGTDIRWFGRNALLSLSGNFHLYATDHFVGATITQANAGNHDSNLNGDVTFEDSSVTLSTVVVQADPHTISLKNAHFATTRAPDGVAGFWTTVPANGINIVSGFPSSFSFGADAGDVHDAASVKSQLVDNSKITLDGAAIDTTTWTEYFSVDIDGNTISVSYSPIVADNRIDTVSASTTSTSATITAVIGAQESGSLVKFAYGTVAPSDADVLAGTTMAVDNGTATASISGLSDLTVYHYLVAIVDSESVEVLASKTGSFVASDYAAVYMNGAWLGEVPSINTDSSVLFLDDFNAINGDVNVANKTVRGATLQTGTLTGTGPIIVWSAQVSNTRDNDLVGAPYGTWNVTAPLFDFRSMSGDGTIRPACSYSFYTTHSDEDIYAEFFTSPSKVQVNGSAANQMDFSIESNATYNEGEENEYRNVSILYWESFPATTQNDAWTMEDGARVKLSSNVRITSLTVPSGVDAKIDLNGKKLAVSALTVGGVSYKGTQTSATLPAILVGDGTLEIGETGTVIVFR